MFSSGFEHVSLWQASLAATSVFLLGTHAVAIIFWPWAMCLLTSWSRWHVMIIMPYVPMSLNGTVKAYRVDHSEELNYQATACSPQMPLIVKFATYILHQVQAMCSQLV
jgi:hypothetical protein